MKYQVIFCRQESFVVEAESREDAEIIALNAAGGHVSNPGELIEHGEEETTRILVEEVR